MYLSRLIVEPRSRAAQRDLANCQAMHRRIMQAFPDNGLTDRARAHYGVLYRVETQPHSGTIQILVQSAHGPDWSRLPAGYLADTRGETDNPACRSVDSAWTMIDEGMHLVFRLRANPTKRIDKRRDDRLAGKRVELQTEAEWLAWLERKAKVAGFELLSVEAMPAGEARDQRQRRIEEIFGFSPAGGRSERVIDTRSTPDAKVHGGKPETGRLTFGAVLFDGRLRVTDADRFRQALATGIGPAKSYGFGLLSIAPVR